MKRIEGFVLNGGRSSRMGTPKGLLKIGERTLAEYAAKTLLGFCDRAYLVGGEQTVSSVEVLPDVPWNNNENKASIFGLRSALQHCTERFAAVLACDMPFVTVDVFKRLWGEIDALETDQADVILPSDKRGWLQPLCAIYERDRTRVAVDAYLETGELQMRGLIGRLRAHVINAANFEDLENAGFLFVNINTPQDMAEAVRMLDK